jgi:3-oxoacyl-[acyl-carrier-protein] synthase III
MAKNKKRGRALPLGRSAHIIGWGMYVPETILSNDDLAAILDTNDEWITSRTGIKERRIAAEGESTDDLAFRAAQKALSITNVLPHEIDLIIVATCTPNNFFPSTACAIQHRLGASKAAAFDLSAACSGFVYGLDMATRSIQAGSITTALVIGAETLSRVTRWQDRGTAVLFGDGAGAAVIQASEEEGGVLSTVLGSDGSGHDALIIPTLNDDHAISSDPDRHLPYKIAMSGGAIMKFATRIIKSSITEALEKAGITIDDVSLIVPHQANERIIQAAARNLKIDPSKFMINLDRYGNTSAATIPIALTEAVEMGKINDGDYVVFVGFGGGLTWAAAVIQWVAPKPVERSTIVVRERQRQISYTLVHVRARLRNWKRKLDSFYRFLTRRQDK